ncbi:MAG: hypothetical protein KKB30_09995 [Proteobacteria bacterium]|nr:hypothetical protein [Pseudomonadota bacterium]MBU1716382.1 hypothetical protein [Pseudomonadota bacterium]
MRLLRIVYLFMYFSLLRLITFNSIKDRFYLRCQFRLIRLVNPSAPIPSRFFSLKNVPKTYSDQIIETLIDLELSDCEVQWLGNETVFERLWSIYADQEGNDDALRELFPHYS